MTDKQEYVRFRTGAGLLKLLSEGLYARNTAPVVELVKNGLDAGAQTIDILLTTKPESSITITDDGEGMNQRGLEFFYTIGDSPKRGKVLNPRGHPLIGNKGVGTTGTYAIGAFHELRTIHDGKVRETNVDYDVLEARGVDWQEYMHEIREQPAKKGQKGQNGTILRITRLRDEYATKQFARMERALQEAIGRELKGHLKYVTVRINGKRVKSYIDSKLESAEPEQIHFDVVVPGLGQHHTAQGTVWILPTALDPQDSGIWPIIREANPTTDGHLYERFGRMPSQLLRLRDRIYGEVTADFLESKLNASRETFVNLATDPLVAAFHTALNVQVKGVLERYVEKQRAQTSKEQDALLDRLAGIATHLFRRYGGSGAEQKTDSVEESGRGKTKGPLVRKWADGEGEEREGGAGGQQKPKQVTVGRRAIRLGGITLPIRYVADAKLPLVSIDDAAEPEILISEVHPLFSDARGRGTEALEDVVTPLMLETLAAYRLGLDGERKFDAIRALADDVLKEYGILKKRMQPGE